MTQTDYIKAGILFLFFCCTGCATVPKGSFGKVIPDAPDYSLEKNWAALPFRKDSADAVPLAEWKDVQTYVIFLPAEGFIIEYIFIH